MKPVPPMSRGDESRLLSAVEAAAADQDADDDPDAALAKAAAAAGVPAGHVGLLVNAYNTARTAYQRETGEDAASKAASFPLASAAGVTRLLCPDAEPRRAEKRGGAPSEYSAGPDWYRTGADQAARAAAVEKFAAVRLTKSAAASAPDVSDDAFRRVYKQAQSDLRAMDRRRAAVYELRVDAVRALEKAADLIDASTGPSWTDVRAVATVAIGGYAEAALDEIGRMRPKLAAVGIRDPYHDVHRNAPIYAAVKAAADAGVALAEAQSRHRAESAALDAKVAEDLAPFLDAPGADEEVGFDLAPSPVPGAPPVAAAPAGDPLLGDADPEEKAASFGANVLTGLTITKLREALDRTQNPRRASSAPEEPGPRYPSTLDRVQRLYDAPPSAGEFEPRVQAALDKLNDPMHDMRLRDLEAQYQIHDMLLNDDVIGSHDPDAVADVVNEISRTAPRQIHQPLLARPLIRRALEMGRLDTFDAGEALKAESELSKLQAPPSTSKSPESPSKSPEAPPKPPAPPQL